MSTFSRNKQILGLAGWLAASFATSAIGALASIQARPFYAEIVRPDWSPPAEVFGPVWMVLYALMGIAAWVVWRTGGFRPNRYALALFVIQLVFNALWSWLFFAWKLGFFSVVDIAVLWVLIVATVISFWHRSRLAAVLLVPYLLWVSFASALNYTLWQLNPQILGQ